MKKEITKITFEPKIMELYKTLENANLDFEEALHEIIDNAYSACSKNNEANISIKIKGNWNYKPTKEKDSKLDLKTAEIIIEDNGYGIEPLDFENVLVPGRKSKNQGQLNQFHIGLKNALMTLGCSKNDNEIYDFEIVSKTKTNEYSYKIDKISNDGSNIEKIKMDWPNNSGTRITIRNIKNCQGRKQDFTMFKYKLGMRYSQFIENDSSKFPCKLNISLSLEDPDGQIISDKYDNKCFYNIKSVKPIYSAASTNMPPKILNGNNWSAEISINYMASTEELDNLPTDDAKLIKSNYQHPYYYHGRKADLIYNGIVVKQIKISELIGQLDASNERTNRGIHLHLKVALNRGFELVNTKNNVKTTNSFIELKDAIKKLMKENKFKFIENDKPISEEDICNTLQSIFSSIPETSVSREYTTLFGLRPDFKINNNGKEYLVEVKKDKGEVKDVIQSIHYSLTTGLDCSLIADGFTDNAINCSKEYLSKLIDAVKNMTRTPEIKLQKLSDWNIKK